MRALPAAILLLTLLAGCLGEPAPPPSPPAASADPAHARMERFLREEYPRADAVEWDAVRIVRVEDASVGDVPLVTIVAVVNREGKEAVAWFDARDLRYLGDRPPSYAEATGGKVDWDLERALRNASGEPLDVSVDYARPPGMLVADDVLEPALVDLALAAALDPEMHRLASHARNRTLTEQEREWYAERAAAAMHRRNREVLPPFMEARAAELRNVTGVANATVPHDLAQSVHVRATPEAIRAIAARSDVLAVTLDRAEPAGSWGDWGARWG